MRPRHDEVGFADQSVRAYNSRPLHTMTTTMGAKTTTAVTKTLQLIATPATASTPQLPSRPPWHLHLASLSLHPT